MSTKLSVTMKLDQRLGMSQQLQQAIMLLQYNTLDLKQLVQQYIETNPLLEVDESESLEVLEEAHLLSSSDDEKNQLQSQNYTAGVSSHAISYEDENVLENYSIPKTLRAYLLEQTLLCKFSQDEQVVAEAIVDAIDENGYLTMSLADIRQALANPMVFNISMIEKVLKTIQMFEPIGIGARDAQECLLIQLNCINNKNKTWENAYRIISDYFEIISSMNKNKLLKQLEITRQEYSDAMVLIRTLNPHPGLLYASSMDHFRGPELYVKKIKNTWRVFLTESILTNIKINNQYQEIIKNNKKHDSYPALKRELEEARWLMKGIKKRNETLLTVASYIIECQKDFLDHGQSYMKPMNISDVATALNFHESTISRVTTGKYIETPRGMFELKYFFPSHVSTKAGNVCSDTAVKALIKEIIDQETEQHIYSDGDIAAVLQEKGINIARRTVAKYREALKIQPSYQRARMQSYVAESPEEEPCE